MPNSRWLKGVSPVFTGFILTAIMYCLLFTLKRGLDNSLSLGIKRFVHYMFGL